MEGYNFRINKYYASIWFDNDTDEKRPYGEDYSHYSMLHRLFNFMRSRGFVVNNDAETAKCIRKDYFFGNKGKLELYSHRYPKGFEIEFFQNINFENKCGGRYDFARFDKMPYQIKLMFLNEVRHIKSFLENLGCKDTSEHKYKFAEDRIKQDFVKNWHHPQKSMDEFTLKDLDGQTDKYSFNHTDRDKKIIYNGQIKYFRHWDGRLWRGRVYHNINNMWWVIVNKYEFRNVADFELFDPTPEDFSIRRKKKGKPPESYIVKKNQIEAAKTKELINELKRRGVKIAV